MSARSLSAVRALAVLALLTLGLHSAAHAQATCTGLCTQQVSCPANGTTSITGTVYAPNGTDPLPNVLVYIPNAPVTAFPTNVQCNPNGTPASGSPLVSTTTAVNGTFTLTNVPPGTNIPLVIQAGKWRRQFVIPNVGSCVNTPASNATGTGTDSTSVPTGHNIHLPQNQGEGDIPKIAIATGKVDAVECVLSKMGVATSEFTNPGGSGRINFYLGLDGPGAQIAGGGTPSETQLEDNLSTLAQYDLVMLPCQGAPYTPDSTALSYMAQYANVGGRIYATHYSYDFLTYPSTTDPTSSITSPFQGVANWDVEQTTTILTDTATINTSFPDGSLLANWLQVVGASTTLGQIPVNTIRQDQDGIVAPTQSYLSISNPPESIQFTFSTPVGAPPATQCGRVLYNEYHVENSANTSSYTFPAECAGGAITAQERFLEYSLFDLGTFSTPPATPTVSVSVTASPNPVTQGDTADTATINITNTGTTATNTTLSLALTLPSGLTATALTPASPTSGWTCNVTTLTCTRGTGLDAGAPDNVDNVLLTFSVSNTATSPQAITATVSNGNLAAPVAGTLSLPVLELPTIAWGPLAPITYGTPLGSTQLDAVASYAGVTVQGTYVYTPPAGTYLTPAIGPQTLSVTFTPDGSGTYAPATQIVGLQVNPAPQIITFTPVPTSPDAAGDTVTLSATGGASGQPVVFSVISGPASLGSTTSTLLYTGAGTVVVAANQAASADGNYAAATQVTATIVVNPATAAYNAGTVEVSQQSSILTATLNFPNGGTLGSLNYLTQGAPNLDFIGCTTGPHQGGPGGTLQTSFSCPPASSGSSRQAVIPVCSVGTVYSAGQICTVSYIFQPQRPGSRLGAVTAVDNSGNLLATSYLTGIGTGPQVVFPGNTATTTLGSGLYSPTGIAVDAAGDVFIADYNNRRVVELPAGGGTQITVASFPTPYLANFPFGVAVDGAGNLFVIRQGETEYYTSNDLVEVPAGCTTAACQKTVSSSVGVPGGVAVDGAGNVYVSEVFSSQVVELPAGGGPQLTVASGLNNPSGVAVDGAGDLFVADFSNNRVVEVPAGCASPYTTCEKLLGSGLAGPNGVAVDAAGDVFICDEGNYRVVEVPVGGGPQITVISGLSSNENNAPIGVAVDGAGDVFVSDTGHNRVLEVNLSQAPSLSFASTDVGFTSSDSPQTVTVANDGYDPTSTNPLTFSGVSTGTTNFLLDSTNACTISTSLEPGQTCALAVDFTPQAPGSPLPDAVTLADNNLNNLNYVSNPPSPQSVPLSGNGLQQTPMVTVAPATFGYGTPTYNFTASISFAGATAPTGAVNFSIDGGASVSGLCTGTTSPLSCTSGGSPTGTISAGTHTITATIAASAGFLQASGSNTLTVNPVAPTINFSVPGVHTYGDPSITLSATSNSGAPITFSYVSGPASVSGNSVTITGAGLVTVSASQVAAGNYTSGSQTATFNVLPKPLTISIIGNPIKPYDTTTAATLTPANYQVGGTIGSDSFTVNQPSGTYGSATAGSWIVTAILTSASVSPISGLLSNYSVPATATGPGSITQAQTTNTITWTTPPAINYGTLLTSAQLDATSTVAGSFGYTPGLGALLNAGPQTLNATFTPNDTLDYASGSASVVLTVNPIAPTINFSVPGVHTYGDSSFNLSATSNSGAPITFSYVSGPATVSGNSVTITGAGLVTVQASQIAAGNYTSGSQNATFNVLPKPLTITIIGNPTKPYDTTTAATLTPSNYQVGGTVGPDAITVNQPSGTYAAATVGPETVTAFLTSSSLSATHGSLSNYTAPASASGPGTITQATTSNTITWATPPAINYGTPLTSAQLNATSSLGSLGNFSYNPALGALLPVGQQTLNATFTPLDTVDYAVGTASVVLTVNPVAPTINFSVPGVHTYGDSSFNLSATSNSGAPITFSYVSGPATVSGNTVTITGAGLVTVSASQVAAGNYTSGSQTATFSVAPKPLTVTAGSYSGTYDGTKHPLSACVVSNNPDNLTCTNSPAGPVGADVTSGAVVVTPVLSGSTSNYSVTSNNGSYSIGPLTVTVTAGGYSGNYDANTHATSACVSTYAGVTCANSPASVGPGVGSGTVTPVASVLTGVASDYTIAPQNSAWSIIPAPSNLNLSCPTSVAYNGAAQTPCTATVTGAGGLNQTVTVGYFANTNVGTATATATFANPNYLTSTKMANFAITPAPLTVTAGSYSGTYDGNAHPLSACVVSPNPDGLTCTNGPAGPVGPDVTSGALVVTPLLSSSLASNYSVTANKGSYAITPAAVTAQAGVGNAVYDGNTHAPSACTVTGAYTGNLTCANSPATVGPDVINKSIAPVVTGSNLSDFTITPVNGSFTINQAPSVTTLTCPASVPYTGAALTPCTATVTGANLNQSVTVIYSSNLHAGTATATATYNGDTDHSGSTKSVNFTITKVNPVITWANPAAITYGTPLSSTQLNATANVPGTFFYTAPVVGLNPAGTLLPAGVSPLGAGFTPTDGTDYNSVSAYVQITVNKATTTTTIAVTTTQTVTGTTATITATVHPQIGGTPTGTVTYYSGSTNLGSAAVGTPFTTPVLPVGADQLTAVYSGDTNFIGSSSSATTVTSIAPTNITLIPALTHVLYPASSVAYTVIVPLKLLQIVSGTITVYDGTTVIGTFNVLPTGVVVGVTPQLSVGTHNLRAVYSGNSQYPPGQSPIETVTVSAL